MTQEAKWSEVLVMDLLGTGHRPGRWARSLGPGPWWRGLVKLGCGRLSRPRRRLAGLLSRFLGARSPWLLLQRGPTGGTPASVS